MFRGKSKQTTTTTSKTPKTKTKKKKNKTSDTQQVAKKLELLGLRGKGFLSAALMFLNPPSQITNQ